MSTEQPVITLTAPTVKHIKSCLQKKPNSAGFRLATKKSGCTGYAYVPEIVDEPKQDDIQFEQDGIPIYVEARSIPLVQGTVLDYVESGLGQKQMVFRNPNETASCGCGESFDIKGGNDE